MSAVRHNLVTARPCHICLVTTSALKAYNTAPTRTHRVTKWIRKMSGGVPTRHKDLLKDYSIDPWKSFLEDVRDDFPSFLP